MSYCPKCGREIIDESLGCPICSVRDNTRPSLSKEQVNTSGNATGNTAQQAQDTQEAEKVDTFTVEDSKETKQKVEDEQQVGATWGKSPNTQYAETTPMEEKIIPTWLKVLIIAILIIVSLFFSGFGAIAGLISGIILMRSPVLDYQKFGKVLTIVSAVLVGLGLLCCLIFGSLMTLGIVSQSY